MEDENEQLYLGWRTRAEVDQKKLIDLLLEYEIWRVIKCSLQKDKFPSMSNCISLGFPRISYLPPLAWGWTFRDSHSFKLESILYPDNPYPLLNYGLHVYKAIIVASRLLRRKNDILTSSTQPTVRALIIVSWSLIFLTNLFVVISANLMPITFPRVFSDKSSTTIRLIFST